MIQSLDPIKLYSEVNSKQWNSWLKVCYLQNDVNQLIDVKKRLQKGMSDVSKKNMQNREIANLFLRWCKSIDDTIKKIQRKKEYNPCDDPRKAHSNLKHLKEKRDRDRLLQEFLKKENY